MRRHDDGEHVGERRQIVARGPACELEQLRREKRIRVEHLEDRARVADRRFGGERRDDARAHLAAERDANADARLHAVAERRRHLVRQQVVQRHRRQRRHLDQSGHALS
jgi:hypothetical protein